MSEFSFSSKMQSVQEGQPLCFSVDHPGRELFLVVCALSQKEQKLIEAFRELKKVEQDMFLRQIIGFQMTMEQ